MQNASLERWAPTAADPWNRAKAGHLLRRAGFGGSEAEIQDALRLGMDRTVDALLCFDPDGVPEFGTVILPTGELLQIGRDLDAHRAQWLYECVHGRHPLREKMALFWHDHFSIGMKYGSLRSHMVPHLNVLRRHGLSPVRRLLTALLTDAAMIGWLDNWSNGRPTNGVPQLNLNFSREIFELYTMGRDGGYSQSDVVEAAKCLSGYGLVMGLTTNRCVFRPEWHVGGSKRVLGHTISNTDPRQDALDLIDVLLRWPATARYLARKLVAFFVADPPPEPLVTECARWFASAGFDVRALMSRLLRSRAFHSEAVRHALIKNPVEFVVGAVRKLAPQAVPSYRFLGDAVARMGWRLLEYFTPAGLEDGLAWMTAQACVERCNFAYEVSRWIPATTLSRLAPDPGDGGGQLLRVLFDAEATQAVRDLAADVLRRSTDPATAQRDLVHALLSSPEYQRN